MQSILLNNSFFEFGNKLGAISAYGLTIFGVIILILVMFRYLDTSDLK